jgi:hypothetical protein
MGAEAADETVRRFLHQAIRSTKQETIDKIM